MGVSQFKQPTPPAPRPPQPSPAQSPRWELGIDRNKVAAFIGFALIAGFGFGYLAARYVAGSRPTTERAAMASGKAPSADSADGESRNAGAGLAEFHRVSKVARADTIEVDGVGGIRLIGVSAPGARAGDTNTGLAQEAIRFTTEALLGKEVRLELEPSMNSGGNKDEAGNTYAYVFTRDGALFNEEIIKQGDAFAKVDQPSKFLDRFRAAEREAMEKMMGVWSPADKSTAAGLLGSSRDKAGRRITLPRPPDALLSSPPSNTLEARTPGTISSDPMIYVSGSDRMYHKDGCEYLGKKGRPMMLSEARAAGYVACGRCFASTVMKAP